MRKKTRLWIGRLLIGIVLFINLQSAVTFLSKPEVYAPLYELSGTVGRVTIQGFGVLFLMWNVPYAVAVIQPSKFRISLYEAVAMQGIGLIGESIIIWRLPPEHAILTKSIFRFIIFDGVGLVALLFATLITHKIRGQRKQLRI
jgi:hypothetical protein